VFFPNFIVSYDHWEIQARRGLRRSWFSLPAKAASPPRSDEVTLSFILSGLVNREGWRLHSISGQLVPLPYCVCGE